MTTGKSLLVLQERRGNLEVTTIIIHKVIKVTQTIIQEDQEDLAGFVMKTVTDTIVQ